MRKVARHRNGLPTQGSQRHADHGCHRQPGRYEREGAATAFGLRDRDRHRRCGWRAKPGAERHQHPGGHAEGKAGSEHGQQIAGDETDSAKVSTVRRSRIIE